MQNKPNFRKAKMKLNFYSTKHYENEPRLPAPAKQTGFIGLPGRAAAVGCYGFLFFTCSLWDFLLF